MLDSVKRINIVQTPIEATYESPSQIQHLHLINWIIGAFISHEQCVLILRDFTAKINKVLGVVVEKQSRIYWEQTRTTAYK